MRGEGAAFLVSSCISCSIVSFCSDKGFEAVTIDDFEQSFSTLKSKQRCICVYRSTFSSNYSLSKLLSYFTDLLHPDALDISPVMIVGDFNLPLIDWFTHISHRDGQHEIFLEFMTDNYFTQFVEYPTRKDNILDLLFTNVPIVHECNVIGRFSGSNHNMV